VSADPEPGDQLGPGDDPSTLELQVRLDDIERSEGRDSARWLGVAAALLLGVVVAPASPALGAAAFVAVMLVATATGFFQVRRGQRRESIENELDDRRADALLGAETTAVRLVALHDELDRLESDPGGVGGIVLLAAAACLLVPLGLAEGIAWVSFAGVFAALVGILRFKTMTSRRRHRRSLDDAIRDLEATASRPPSDGMGGGAAPPR
jgi:membrane protein implicated in regulation of membrane protease activity